MGINGGIATGVAPQPGGVLLGNVAYIPPGFEGLYLRPFSYNIIITPAATGTTVGSVQIQNDSWFVVVEQTADFWDAATGNTTQILPQAFPGAVRVLDTSSGGYSMDQPTPISAYFGTSQQPFVWLYRAPVYQPGGQLQLEFTNRLAASQRAQFTFTGFKVFDQDDLKTPTRTNGS